MGRAHLLLGLGILVRRVVAGRGRRYRSRHHWRSSRSYLVLGILCGVLVLSLLLLLLLLGMVR